MKALIFNIQKFSLNDGPGIRTVVFFKGCPLSCAWCSNPESQCYRKQILWNRDRCVHCGQCVKACPTQSIHTYGDEIQIKHKSCIACEACVNICPNAALEADSRFMSVDEILEICRKDIDFYEESGGGVTLSGGEVLHQPRFASELLKKLHSIGINTAIETSCYAPLAVFRQVLEHTDHLLADLKHWDSNLHKSGTAVPNEQILRNIRDAIQRGQSILLRIPVIPGYNDAPQDAKAFAQLILKLGLNEVQLLPFHQFGEKKYDMLGQAYNYTDIPSLHESDLTAYQKEFVDNGVKAFF